jgi:hypothetical protein
MPVKVLMLKAVAFERRDGLFDHAQPDNRAWDSPRGAVLSLKGICQCQQAMVQSDAEENHLPSRGCLYTQETL